MVSINNLISGMALLADGKLQQGVDGTHRKPGHYLSRA